MPYKYNASRQQWRKNNPDKVRLQAKASEASRHNSAYKKNFGITLEQYNEMFLAQNGQCLICSRHQTKFKQRLAVDHNHKTGQVRGLLCHKCNFNLGIIEDSLFVVQAHNYLRRFSSALRNS